MMKYTWDGDEGRFWRDLRASLPVSMFSSRRCRSFPLNILASSHDPGKAQHGLVIGGNVCMCRITWGWGCNGRSVTLPTPGTAFCRVHTYNMCVHPKSIYVTWVEHLLHREGSALLPRGRNGHSMLETTTSNMSPAPRKHRLGLSPFGPRKKDDMLDHQPVSHMVSFTKPRQVRSVASKMRKIQLVSQKPTEKIWYL